MQSQDSAKINDSATKEKAWAERNKAYLQSLAAQKKLAEDKQALQLEKEQVCASRIMPLAPLNSDSTI